MHVRLLVALCKIDNLINTWNYDRVIDDGGKPLNAPPVQQLPFVVVPFFIGMPFFSEESPTYKRNVAHTTNKDDICIPLAHIPSIYWLKTSLFL